MNDKITLPTLIQLLALATGDRKKQSEDFIKEFFGLISSVLSEGDQVKIKDLGVFKTVEVEERKSVNVTNGEDTIIPSHRKVVFIPSKEIAALVNSPFEMFETVELEDDEPAAEEIPVEDGNPVYDHEEDRGEPEEPDPVYNDSDDPADGEAGREEYDDESGTESSALYQDEIEIAGTYGEDVEDAVIESIFVNDSSFYPQPDTDESGAEFCQPDEPEDEDETEPINEAAVSPYSIDDTPGADYSFYADPVGESETPSERTHHEAVREPMYVYDDRSRTEDRAEVSEALSVAGSQDNISGDSRKDSAEEAPVRSAAVKDESVMKDHKNKVTDMDKKRTSFAGGFLTGFVAAILMIIIAGGILYLFEVPPFYPGYATQETVSPPDNREAEYDAEDSLNAGVEVIKSDGTDSPLEAQAQDPASANQKDEVPTQPSDKKVYDTISKTRYLTTMAKEHYGNYHLWPYIYMENASFLGHPDRIRPGTQVVVPPLSKYGVDPKNPKDIETAKKKGAEIYSRYK